MQSIHLISVSWGKKKAKVTSTAGLNFAIQISIEPTKANCQYTLVSLMNTVPSQKKQCRASPAGECWQASTRSLVWCGQSHHRMAVWPGLGCMVGTDGFVGCTLPASPSRVSRAPAQHRPLTSPAHPSATRRSLLATVGAWWRLRWGPGAGHLDVNLTYRCSALRLSSESISMCFVHAAASHSGASPSPFSVQVSAPARPSVTSCRVRAYVRTCAVPPRPQASACVAIWARQVVGDPVAPSLVWLATWHARREMTKRRG